MGWPIPELRCAICGRQVDPFGPYFRASGAFLPASDALAKLCNASFHWACYERWPHRPRFADRHVEAWIKANRSNPFWWAMHVDERVYVSVNPERPIEEASVRLRAVGSDIRVPLPRWTEWLAAPERVCPGLQAIERAGLAEVLPTLRARFPDDHAVVNAVDPGEKPGRGATKRTASGGRSR